MSALGLTRPEHRERLAHCCHAVLVGEMYSTHALRTMPSLDRACFEALSSPTESAAIVRALLEGCGAPALLVNTAGILAPGWPVQVYYMAEDVPDWPTDDEEEYDDKSVEIDADKLPALVLRLLACTTKEEALAALREHGR